MSTIRFLFLTLFLSLCVSGTKACEIALALAVDVSGSVGQDEYELQMTGLADALRDPTIADALVSKKANVILVQWTGASRQTISVPWSAMNSLEDVERFSSEVKNTQRRWRNFSTAIGDALIFITEQYEKVPQCKRKVIDVSGDGSSNEGVGPSFLRRSLEEQGFTINGLAIEGSEKNVTGYYRDFVIAGEGAFVMTANNFDDYRIRIRQKLFREITNQFAQIPLPLIPSIYEPEL